jgi:hypothetical protein
MTCREAKLQKNAVLQKAFVALLHVLSEKSLIQKNQEYRGK